MKTVGQKAILGILLALLMLNGCSSQSEASVEATPGRSILPTVITQSPTETVYIPTATPDINAIPVSEAAQLILDGSVGYPTNWSDDKKFELAVEIAGFLNKNIVADEIYVPMSFPETGDLRVGWDPVLGYWRSNHNTVEGSLDFSGDSFSPLVIAGYRNSSGQEVFIDFETSEQKIVPNLGLYDAGNFSITQLLTTPSQELKNLVLDLMIGAETINEGTINYINERRGEYYVLPVVIYERNDNYLDTGKWAYSGFNYVFNPSKPRYYAFQTSYGDPNDQIPEVGVGFLGMPTNVVLLPVIDSDSNQIMFWVSIYQGLRFSANYSFVFARDQNPIVYYLGSLDKKLFGNNPKDSLGLFSLGKTTALTWKSYPTEPFLEFGQGMGSESTVLDILNAGGIREIVNILSTVRAIFMSPNILLYQLNE